MEKAIQSHLLMGRREGHTAVVREEEWRNPQRKKGEIGKERDREKEKEKKRRRRKNKEEGNVRK